MSPEEFKAAQDELGLSNAQLANILDVTSSAITRWTSNGKGAVSRPNPTAVRAMRWMLAGFRPPEFPDFPRRNLPGWTPGRPRGKQDDDSPQAS